jgi:signal transduction histidine kinase
VRYISHELRTPLNTAFLGLRLLSSELKASKDPKDMERYETLCDVNMSCTAAVDILNNLLCYEKLESGILELHKESIVVDSFLKDCVTMFSAQARECGVIMTMITDATDNDIEVTSDDNNILSTSLLPTDSIFADKFKMDQVIRNLMSNALKFTPRGGHVTVKATFVHDTSPRISLERGTMSPCRVTTGISVIKVSKKKAESMSSRYRRHPTVAVTYPEPDPLLLSDPVRGKLVVDVTDTGAGISRENQKRLFTEIVQFSPEKLQAGGGSGLGLWITQEILNLHDGSISVSSEGEGMGSSFTIEMPMLRWCAAQSVVAPARTPSFILPPLKTYNTSDETVSGCDDIELIGGSASSETKMSRTIQQNHAQAQAQAQAQRQVQGQGQGHGNSFDLLIVDDSRLCRKMLLKCLRADGHTCFEAEDGLEAIAMVKERIGHARGGHGRPFDAVLMDFVMPNMDGPTATKEIRALGYKAPIFGVTGNGEWNRRIA